MPHTMLRFPTVKARTGLSRSTIYLRISQDEKDSPPFCKYLFASS